MCRHLCWMRVVCLVVVPLLLLLLLRLRLWLQRPLHPCLRLRLAHCWAAAVCLAWGLLVAAVRCRRGLEACLRLPRLRLHLLCLRVV